MQDPCGGETRLLATLNRPTVGYSACAVAAHTVVFEEGYQRQSEAANRTLVQYPQSFTRIGVAPRVEFDVIGPAYNRLLTNGKNTAAGLADSGVGFKYEVPPTGNCTYGFDGLYTTPNGSRAFTGGGYGATVNADIGCSITRSFGVGTTQALGTVSGTRSDGTFARYPLWMPSLVATQQFGNGYQFYFEYVYQSKIAPDAAGRAFVDYGIQHILGPRLEVDGELGHALTGNASARFNYIGVGVGLQIDER